LFLSICHLASSNQSQHDFGRKQRGKASGPHPNLPPAGEGATPKAWLFALAHPPLGEGWDGGWHPTVAAAPAPLGVVHAVDVPPVLLQWTPRDMLALPLTGPTLLSLRPLRDGQVGASSISDGYGDLANGPLARRIGLPAAGRTQVVLDGVA